MRKTGLFAVAAALILATGIGGWAASNTQARVATAASIGINPFQMMTNAQASGHGALSGFFDGIPLKPVASIRQSFGFQSRLTLGHLPPDRPRGFEPRFGTFQGGVLHVPVSRQSTWNPLAAGGTGRLLAKSLPHSSSGLALNRWRVWVFEREPVRRAAVDESFRRVVTVARPHANRRGFPCL